MACGQNLPDPAAFAGFAGRREWGFGLARRQSARHVGGTTPRKPLTMHQPPLPLTRDLVFVGGGHTHALVLRKWGMDPLPGARLTLIDPTPVTAYSGMLPGHVAGHYTRVDLA